ncbi:MAG: hypothetical protein IPN34_00040 [Planctomycetes bacterium]|nr:hypothetical protein [Planctomycetota bacterium]
MRALSTLALAGLGAVLGALLLGRGDGDGAVPRATLLARDGAGARAERAERRWARTLAAGGSIALGAASEGPSEGRSAATNAAADPAAELELRALGPLSEAEEAPLYEEEIRRLAEIRRALSALDGATQDERAHWELLELRSDELRMLATLELLDRDEYWVFPAEAPDAAMVGRLVGRYGVRVTTKDGAPVKVVYPYAAERFPLLAELVPARRAAEAAAQDALAREFAALPLERRALYRTLIESAALAPGNEHEAFLQRYAGVGLELDPERLVLVRP